MSVRIFKNKEDQDQFDKQGFLCMAFLSTDEIQELNVFFDEMHPDLNENGFFSGSYISDFDYKKKASDKITINDFFIKLNFLVEIAEVLQKK